MDLGLSVVPRMRPAMRPRLNGGDRTAVFGVFRRRLTVGGFFGTVGHKSSGRIFLDPLGQNRSKMLFPKPDRPSHLFGVAETAVGRGYARMSNSSRRSASAFCRTRTSATGAPGGAGAEHGVNRAVQLTMPRCQGTNSLSPSPSNSLLVRSPDAVRSMCSKMR